MDNLLNTASLPIKTFICVCVCVLLAALPVGAQSYYGPAQYLQTAVYYGGQVVQIQNTDSVCVGVNSLGKPQTFILPAQPMPGQYVTVKDGGGNAATANITVVPYNNVGTIDGASSYIISSNYGAASFVLSPSGSWSVVANNNTSSGGGGSGSPGGTNGQIQFNNNGNFGGFTVSGDGTLNSSGTLSVTKTNGMSFASSATIDTTNAANISSGSLSANRLPSTVVQTNQSNTYSSGTQDASGASSVKVPTVAAGDNTTNAASTSFVTTAVNNAIAAVNPAAAVTGATTSALPNSPTYNNGVAGVGATLTAGGNSTLTVDGHTYALNERILVKNQSSAFQNGVYYVNQVGSGILPWILIRALDYDQPSDINNTGAIPVVTGTTNAQTTWVETANITTVGTDSLTFTQFSINPTVAAQTNQSNNFTADQVPNAAGGNNLGTTALPWGNVYVGGAATNNNKMTSATTTAGRTFTLPDANSNPIQPLGSQTSNQWVAYIDSNGVQQTVQINFTNLAGTIGVPSQIPAGYLVHQSATIDVSSAQLLTLNSSPIQLIAAPGAGKIIVVDRVESTFNATSTAYTGGGIVQAGYGSSGTSSTTQLFTNAQMIGTTVLSTSSSPTFSGATTSNLVNMPYTLVGTASNYSNGTGTMNVTVDYFIVSQIVNGH